MPTAMTKDNFAEFQQHLMGTWTNQTFPGSKQGGTDNPLSYNIMPLPQKSLSPTGSKGYSGFILKNFTYFETIRFNSNMDTTGEVALSVLAPNRDTTYQQDARALFYSQQVHFAEGPGATDRSQRTARSQYYHRQTDVGTTRKLNSGSRQIRRSRNRSSDHPILQFPVSHPTSTADGRIH